MNIRGAAHAAVCITDVRVPSGLFVCRWSFCGVMPAPYTVETPLAGPFPDILPEECREAKRKHFMFSCSKKRVFFVFTDRRILSSVPVRMLFLYILLCLLADFNYSCAKTRVSLRKDADGNAEETLFLCAQTRGFVRTDADVLPQHREKTVCKAGAAVLSAAFFSY